MNISDMQKNAPNMKRIILLWGQAGGQYEGKAWLGSNAEEVEESSE